MRSSARPRRSKALDGRRPARAARRACRPATSSPVKDRGITHTARLTARRPAGSACRWSLPRKPRSPGARPSIEEFAKRHEGARAARSRSSTQGPSFAKLRDRFLGAAGAMGTPLHDARRSLDDAARTAPVRYRRLTRRRGPPRRRPCARGARVVRVTDRRRPRHVAAASSSAGTAAARGRTCDPRRRSPVVEPPAPRVVARAGAREGRPRRAVRSRRRRSSRRRCDQCRGRPRAVGLPMGRRPRPRRACSAGRRSCARRQAGAIARGRPRSAELAHSTSRLAARAAASRRRASEPTAADPPHRPRSSRTRRRAATRARGRSGGRHRAAELEPCRAPAGAELVRLGDTVLRTSTAGPAAHRGR